MLPRLLMGAAAAALALLLALWLRKPAAAERPPAPAPAAVDLPRDLAPASGAAAEASAPSTTAAPAPTLHGLRLLKREDAERRGWTPPPPKEKSARQVAGEEVMKRWSQTPISINCTDQPLLEFLDDLRKQYGLDARVDPEIDVEAHTVTFRVDDLAADQAMDLVLRMADLAWCVDERGTFWVTERDRVEVLSPGPEKPRASVTETAELVRWRTEPDAPPMTEQRAAWLKGKTLTASIANVPLKDALEEIAKAADMSLWWSEAALAAVERAPIASVVGEDLPLGPTLERLLASGGLDISLWSHGSGGIQTAEEVRAHIEWEAYAEKCAKEMAREQAAFGERRVRIEGKVLAVRDVAAQLEAQLGVAVRVMPALETCEATWESDGLEQRAGEVLDILAKDAPLAWGWLPELEEDGPADAPFQLWLVDRR
ncbi:MAG: hypothetical protein IT452_23260 [Planctomycetia bacterium]|nr:hypothetical protein [Planctomycetia bacterium]